MTDERKGVNQNISITMKCYAHVEPLDENTIRESLERVFGNMASVTENTLLIPDRTKSHESL